MPSRRGPAPLPSAVKQLRGTEKKCRKNTREPKPQVGAPPMPASVAKSRDAAECWKTTVDRMVRLKVITVVDGAALEGMCVAFARAREADREIKRLGLLIKDQWGKPVANPAVAISKNSWAEFRKFAQEFGITPSSRSRVNADNSEGDEGAQDTEDLIFGDKSKIAGHIGR